jgi:cytochrome c oxidase subunit 2
MVARFRATGPDDPEPPQIHGHRGLELTWTLIPLAIVTVLTVLTAGTILRTHPEPTQAPDVEIIGHQWWWEVRYSPSGLITANEVHVPVGRKTLIKLATADVIHDFWVPALGPKEDTTPGENSYLWIEPSRAGVYQGACAEFCGNQHAWMLTRVIADDPATFQAWIKAETSAPPLPPEASKGQQLFATLACVNCHRGPGMATGPTAGPDLTWVGARQTLGAGVLQNSPGALARWLQDPQSIKPQCQMPDFHLTPGQVAELTAYLWRTHS